jgi:serine O-acetyltransferase
LKLSITPNEIALYLKKQLEVFFPDNSGNYFLALQENLVPILERVEFCFAKVNNRYFKSEQDTIFDHLHADQYAMFLYFAANTLFRNGADENLCKKIFHLNRYLHGIDVFYEVELPDVFLFIHPIGTVLGRGTYSDYLLVYQRCGVGGNHDIYPTLGEYVSLHPGATILGDSNIGSGCKISAGSILIDKNLESNNIYIGNTIKHIIKPTSSVSQFWK